MTMNAKPRRPSVTRCIYFPDGSKLEVLEALRLRFPRASLSSIFAQVVGPMIEAVEKMGPHDRSITITTKVFF